MRGEYYLAHKAQDAAQYKCPAYYCRAESEVSTATAPFGFSTFRSLWKRTGIQIVGIGLGRDLLAIQNFSFQTASPEAS
jgi:hypothetical protein